MRPRAAAAWVLGGIALSALWAACGGGGVTPSAAGETPTATPYSQAQPAGVTPQAAAPTPTPTGVPAEVRAVVVEFARGHSTVVADWESFHTDFDTFRQSLLACDASSQGRFLRSFASRFIEITSVAGGLPRDPIVRKLSDKVIGAAKQEEKALRLLRDTWKAGDPSVFENVSTARSAAAAAQKEVDDALLDLKARTDPSARDVAEGLKLAVQQLNVTWDAFHRRYDAFRAEEPDLTSAQMAQGLSQLVDELGGLVVAVRDLPAPPLTRSVVQILARAAESEELALRKLRGTFQKAEAGQVGKELPAGPSGDAGAGAPGAGSKPLTGSGQSSPATSSDATQAAGEKVVFVVRDRTLFDAFDAKMVEGNATRRDALRELADIALGTSEEAATTVQGFARRYTQLIVDWDAFHDDYDSWRRSEGGCDRAGVTSNMGGFVVRFGGLAQRVRGLPRATVLRPLGELFVDAVEREEEALRMLRDTWRPFDSEVYAGLDRARNDSRKLLRQVAAGVQDLLSRYDISAQELKEGKTSAP